MKSHAKAVVIGGGVVGCSVLFHLAKAGCHHLQLPRAQKPHLIKDHPSRQCRAILNKHRLQRSRRPDSHLCTMRTILLAPMSRPSKPSINSGPLLWLQGVFGAQAVSVG